LTNFDQQGTKLFLGSSGEMAEKVISG